MFHSLFGVEALPGALLRTICNAKRFVRDTTRTPPTSPPNWTPHAAAWSPRGSSYAFADEDGFYVHFDPFRRQCVNAIRRVQGTRIIDAM